MNLPMALITPVRARLYRVPLVYTKYKYQINLYHSQRAQLNFERSKSLQTSPGEALDFVKIRLPSFEGRAGDGCNFEF